MLATPFLLALATLHSVSAASVSLASRQYETPIAEFEHPPSRGTHALSSTTGPCQGITPGGRFDFPVSSGGQLTLSQTTEIKNLKFSYSTVDDPQSLSDFTSMGMDVAQRYAGTTCLDAVSFSALGLSAGQEITIMMQYQSGSDLTNYYECSDLTLVADSAYVSDTFTCSNVTTNTDSATTPATTTPSTSTPSSSSSSSGLSPAIGGVIGGVIVLVVMLAALFTAAKLGYAAFGKATAKRWQSEATVLAERTQSRTDSMAPLDAKRVDGY